MAATNPVACAQVPPPGALTLDHVGHFVPDMDAASAALERVGFTLAPFSIHSHRLQPNGPLVPAGTGNRCIMFAKGFIEILTPTAHTPLGDQLRSAIARYVGLHLIAFGTSAPQDDWQRLQDEGFTPLAAVDLQRPIGTEEGEGTARFTVVRVPPGTMAEGRIQYCHQRTPELLWQERWLDHANGTEGLDGVVVCVSDPKATGERYARFSGLRARTLGKAWCIDTAHGALYFVEAAVLKDTFGVEAPVLPWIAGSLLSTADFGRTAEHMRKAAAVTHLAGERLLAILPPAVGGFLLYGTRASAPLVFG